MTVISGEVKVRADALIDAGLKARAISSQLQLNYNTVKSYCAKVKLRGNLPPPVRVRKNYFQGRIPGNIRRYIENNPCANLGEIKAALDLEISTVYLGRYLKSVGLQRTKAKRSILITDRNKALRVEFCRQMLTKSDDELRSILWSDETMVKAYPNGEAVFYRSLEARNDVRAPRVQQGGTGQMLWGCVSFHAKGPLVAVDGIINGESYLSLLQNVVKPEMDESERLGRRLTFQQDNAKAHKTRPVMDYLANWGYDVLEWPAQSPDLSPIEVVWNILKMRMKAMRPRPRTKATMLAAMLQIYDDLELETIQKVFRKLRSRLERCVELNGDVCNI